MYPIVETRFIKMYCPMLQKNALRLKNVCLNKDGKEMIQHLDGYYYLNKDNSVSKRRVKL